MRKKIKRSGKKFSRRLSKLSRQASVSGRDHIHRNLIRRFSHVAYVRLQILEWFLLVGIILFFAITQSFWYASSYASNSFGPGGTFTEATLGKVNSLNPLFATTNSEKALSKLAFATLTEIDASGHTGLGLAESIKPDSNNKNWIVTLKPNLKWSDNADLTADDVVFTTELLQNDLINTSFSSRLNNITVKKLSDRKIQFSIPAAFANFASALDFPILPAHILKDVAPERLLEHQFSSKPITSGPFTFSATQTIGTKGESIVYLNANPNHYKGTPMLDTFAIHAFLNHDEIKNALESGTVTATADLPSDFKTNSKDLNHRTTTLNSGVFAFFNLNNQILSQHAVRQALRQGVNTNAIRQQLNGEARLDFPITQKQIDLKYPDFPKTDISSAKTTIEKLNLPKDHKLNIVTVSTSNLPTVARNLSREFRRIGINSTVSVHQPNQEFVLGILKPRAYDVLVYEIDFGAEPDLFPYFHSSQAGQSGLNFANYKSSFVDNLILSARDSTDSETRATKYQRLLELWLKDIPAIGIYQTSLSYYFNSASRIFSADNRLTYPVDRFNDVTSWAVNPKAKNRTP